MQQRRKCQKKVTGNKIGLLKCSSSRATRPSCNNWEEHLNWAIFLHCRPRHKFQEGGWHQREPFVRRVADSSGDEAIKEGNATEDYLKLVRMVRSLTATMILERSIVLRSREMALSNNVVNLFQLLLLCTKHHLKYFLCISYSRGAWNENIGYMRKNGMSSKYLAAVSDLVKRFNTLHIIYSALLCWRTWWVEPILRFHDEQGLQIHVFEIS